MHVSEQSKLVDKDRLVLITGSNGFIGSKVVETLLKRGFRNLRCLVRPTSRLDRLDSVIQAAGPGVRVDVIRGDLTSPEDCARVATGVSVVYHLAAGFDKSFAGAFMNSALATRNLIEAFLAVGAPARFVNVSSLAVYSNRTLKRGAPLDESSPLETHSQERYDAYGFGKLKQEEIVRDYGKRRGLPFVILRPGTVFGPGKKDLTGRIGIDTFGFFMHVGGSNLLPLTFVDNCAEEIVFAGLVPGVDGDTLNVVDDQLLTSAQFLKAYKRVRRLFSLRVPYPVAYAFCWAWETYSNRSGGQLPSAFNCHRCAAEWKGNRFPNTKIRQKLRWTPRVGVNDAMAAFLSQFATADK